MKALTSLSSSGSVLWFLYVVSFCFRHYLFFPHSNTSERHGTESVFRVLSLEKKKILYISTPE